MLATIVQVIRLIRKGLSVKKCRKGDCHDTATVTGATTKRVQQCTVPSALFHKQIGWCFAERIINIRQRALDWISFFQINTGPSCWAEPWRAERASETNECTTIEKQTVCRDKYWLHSQAEPATQSPVSACPGRKGPRNRTSAPVGSIWYPLR